MSELHVYLHHERVGTLRLNRGRLHFQYTAEYLEQKNARPLAYTLPLQADAYEGASVVSFFSNLLPDESVRVRIARILGISPENTFALLKAIGEDCAGAVSLFTPERHPVAASAPVYAELNEEEAGEILTHLSERPLNIGAENFHISGAGAQDKLVACVEDGRISLPLNGTPSTHIIKPAISRFPESVFNELYCMKLAAVCGLTVADCSLLRIKNEPYYVTTRYDRIQVDGRWERLHQEDFCQLLGYDPSIKYQSEGGADLKECFELLRRMEVPASDILEFLSRIIFIFLIGNGDAHAKNFSVLYQDSRPRLAPAYDMLSTTVYPSLMGRMAMKIDNTYEFRRISRNKLVRTALKCGLTETIVNRQINKLQKTLSACLPNFTRQMEELHPARIYRDIHAGILQRMEQIRPQE